MRSVFFLSTFSLFFLHFNYSQTTSFNPGGSYKLVSKTQKKNGETYGRFGTINVKKISDTELYFEMDINRGAPSYNNGFAGGTVQFKDNQAIYTTDLDSSCKITMVFTPKGITVIHEATDMNMSCGFGHAVLADGFYRKTKTPVTFSER